MGNKIYLWEELRVEKVVACGNPKVEPAEKDCRFFAARAKAR